MLHNNTASETCVGVGGAGVAVGVGSAPHPARARVTTSMVATSNNLPGISQMEPTTLMRAPFWASPDYMGTR